MKKQNWQFGIRGKPLLISTPDKIRGDDCGALMVYSAYGDRSSSFGWEIDYIMPESKGGTDDLSNLRPLQWQNNASKGDNNKLNCVVTSNGNTNIQI